MTQSAPRRTTHPSLIQFWNILFWVLMILIVLAFASLSACTSGNAVVGSSLIQTPTTTSTRNGAPNTLSFVEDPEGRGTWNGNSTGPNAYATVDADGTQEMSTGVVPRRIFFDRETGRLVISSGSDVSWKSAKFNPQTSLIEIDGFTTSSSEPLRASNEGLALIADRYKNMDQASRDAFIAELEENRKMVEVVSPLAASVLGDLIKGLLAL